MQRQHIKDSSIVFANLTEKNIEAYVDDMIVKSKEADQHIVGLEEVSPPFENIR